MKNHRISTTISQKHWELLNKHAEKYETQQKAIECALDYLENSSKQSIALTEEEKLWTRFKRANSLCIIEKDVFKLLLETADIELLKIYVVLHKPMEYAVEYYLQKPLQKSSLKEVIDALVVISKISNWFDTVDYTDDGSYYSLIITHSLGLNSSKLNIIGFESIFKGYGVNYESTISERTIFMKIFKNQ